MTIFVCSCKLPIMENKTEKIMIRLTKKTLKNLERRAVEDRRKVAELARIIIEKEVDHPVL